MTKRKARKTIKTKSEPRKKKHIPFGEKDFLTLKNMESIDFKVLFDLTHKIKKSPKNYYNKLQGKTMGLLFQKPSSRTRVAFEVGITGLGGTAVYLSDTEIQMGQREPLRDVAQTLSRYFDAIVLRTFGQKDMEDFANHSRVPVINGLSDLEHPCQILSDLYTIQAKLGRLKGVNITYIGDSNNILNSLMYGVAFNGANLSIVTPRGYEPLDETLKEIKAVTKVSGSKFTVSNNPFASLKNAHIIYTDVWVSMGQERQKEQRLRDFQPFQVSQAIVSKALPDALVMHCLPAHRGEEITNEVLEGPHSIVMEQAENKLHVQKALLMQLLRKK
jgi:ornithine carbamoyltransferase